MTLIHIFLAAFSLGICEGWNKRWHPDLSHVDEEVAEGSVWPQPQKLVYHREILSLDQRNFRFTTDYKCDILAAALERYSRLIFPHAKTHRHGGKKRARGGLSELVVRVEMPCGRYPYMGMNESYSLEVGSGGGGELVAHEIWGALRGLETFSQLIYSSTPHGKVERWDHFKKGYPRGRTVWGNGARGEYLVERILGKIGKLVIHHYSLLEQRVDDAFSGNHRWDLLAQNKFNVFHWHIVDDPSFPYQSSTFPDLNAKGAYAPAESHSYSPAAVAAVVEYARLRGVRVLPEYDTPGHTLSWGKGQANFLTPCYKDGSAVSGQSYLPDVSSEKTWDFLYALFTELRKVFPDNYIHLGGDEVSYYYKCWQSNPRIQRLMEVWNITTMRGVENYYFSKFIPLLEQMDPNLNFLLWDDVFPEIQLPRDKTILHEWRSQNGLAAITKAGYKGILSSCWYLDHIELDSAANPEWYKFYRCDPQDFNGTQVQKDLVLGGEACLWGEFVDATNLTPRLWRGHAAEPPQGPSYCPVEYVPKTP